MPRHREVLEALLGVVLLFLAIVISDGLFTLSDGAQQLQPARQLRQTGQVATARESLVYLRADRGLNVHQVRVRLDVRPQLVYLTDIQAPQADLDDVEDPPPVGWQPATPLTGFVAPFEVRYLWSRDGSIVVMASADAANQGSYAPIVQGAATVCATWSEC